MLQNHDSVSVTASETRDIENENSCDDCKEKNKSLETLRYGLSFGNNFSYCSFFSGIENYNLDTKTNKTLGNYLYGVVTDNRTKPERYPLTLDVGLLCGAGKFDKDKKNYFQHTRSDTYAKLGATTNLRNLHELYGGLEHRQGALRSFVKFGLGTNDNEVKPVFGFGFSIDLDNYSGKSFDK
jgi:hypothetical protein